MQELHAEYTRIKTRIEECEEAGSAALLEQKAAEGSAEEHLAKAAHYQQQIAQVTTQREYGALLNEIDNAKKIASEFEECSQGNLTVNVQLLASDDAQDQITLDLGTGSPRSRRSR